MHSLRHPNTATKNSRNSRQHTSIIEATECRKYGVPESRMRLRTTLPDEQNRLLTVRVAPLSILASSVRQVECSLINGCGYSRHRPDRDLIQQRPQVGGDDRAQAFSFQV